MDEADKRKVGEQLEPGGRPKAPGRLELVQRFVNTHNHEFPLDWDRIGTATKARAWLKAKGLPHAVDEQEVAQLREFREVLRAHMVGKPAPALEAELTVRLDEDGRTRLETASAGADGVIATLLGIVHEAQLSGDWARMKGCRQCEYAFYDRSKNRSATWCAMSICGNRTKNRRYREKRQ